MRTLYRQARIHTPSGAPCTAMLVQEDAIAWLGDETGADAIADGADRTVGCAGALLTPAFVDAHVHLTATGLTLTGPGLRDCRSAADVLDAVAAAVRGGAEVVLGDGWDEFGWPDPALPGPAELERAAGGRPVYLARVDAHSALASAGLRVAAGLPADGPPLLTLQEHHAVRQAALVALRPAQRRRAQAAALDTAARLGIACVHEMSGPEIAGEADLRELIGWTDGAETRPEVIPYWGELGADGIRRAAAFGAVGAAGDLFCDGSLGSHTAALHAPYADAPDERGALRYDAEQIGAHVLACTAAGLQAGFHAIGDAAIDAVLTGMERAAAKDPRVRVAGHRIEHVEMLADPSRLAALGVHASMQPAFDAAWGGPQGMYAARLGAARAKRLNDLAALHAAAVDVALGSDSPVTPLDPWAGVRAAVASHEPARAIPLAAAFADHTVGGWRAARRDAEGVLAAGRPATFAVWTLDPGVDVVAGLPHLSDGAPLPSCRLTVRDGRVLFDAQA